MSRFYEHVSLICFIGINHSLNFLWFRAYTEQKGNDCNGILIEIINLYVGSLNPSEPSKADVKEKES